MLIPHLQCFGNVINYVLQCALLSSIALQEMAPTGTANDLVVNVSDVHNVDNIIVEVVTQHTP